MLRGQFSPRSAALTGEPGVDDSTRRTRLDDEALQHLRELDPTGANRLLERVFHAFETSAGRLMPQLRVAQETNNHLGVRYVSHTLKSASAHIGAIKLSCLCAEMEAMADLCVADGLPERIDQLTLEMTSVLEALRQFPGVHL